MNDEPFKVGVNVLGVEKYNSTLSDYVAHVRGAKRTVLRTEFKALMRLTGTFTPPKTKKQGEAALRRDVENAVRPIRASAFDSDTKYDRAVRKALAKGDYETLQIIFSRSSDRDLKRAQIVRWSPELHRRAQNRRKNVRKWTGLATPDVAQEDAYIAGLLPRVGNAKGGWAAGLMGVGGTPPKWVARHAYAGTFKDALDNPLLGFIEARNRSTWAKSGLDDRVIGNAMRSRSNVLVEKMRKATADAQRKAGL